MLFECNGLNILLEVLVRGHLHLKMIETQFIRNNLLSFVLFQMIYVSILQIMQNGSNLKRNTECTWHFWKHLAIQFITRYFTIFRVFVVGNVAGFISCSNFLCFHFIVSYGTLFTWKITRFFFL